MYYWFDIYPILKGKHKQKCNDISFDCYYHIVSWDLDMKTVIETKIDVIWEETKLKYIIVQWRKLG